jgi:hypothetical protein
MATFLTADRIWSVPLERVADDATGLSWSAEDSVAGSVGYLIQAVDDGGNVALASGKGTYLETPRYDLYLPITLRK